MGLSSFASAYRPEPIGLSLDAVSTERAGFLSCGPARFNTVMQFGSSPARLVQSLRPVVRHPAVPAIIADVLDVTQAQFEALVAEALDTIPAELAAQISNCVVLVADDVPEGFPSVLGLYEGTPLTQRGSWYVGVLPDRITLYRKPILRVCRTMAEVIAEVRITVIHEFAHHFGIDDAHLHELGWG